MDEERALLAALAADPTDDAGWLAYADWLEERDDVRSPFLRLLVALGRGAVALSQVKSTAERLEQLRAPLDPGWLGRCVGLWGARSLRLRITDVRFQGALLGGTLVEGVLESGTISTWDGVALPLEDEEVALDWVRRLEGGGKVLERASAGQGPPVVTLAWPGRLLGVCRGGVLVRSPEADAELERRLNLGLAGMQWSPRVGNVIRRLNVTTVRDLASRTPEEVLAGKSFGETTLREVRHRLGELGLALGMGRFRPAP
jgi:uncharacterized protein (TIGR02996 family)